MNIDRVYVAVINAIISHNICSEGRVVRDEYKSIPIKFALIYSKHDYLGNEYYDLQTGEKYKTLKDFPGNGDLVVNVKRMITYRAFLYNEQVRNSNLKVKDNMFKRKMLTLFNDAQKRGKMEVRNEKNI